jgi:hypothetical protein
MARAAMERAQEWQSDAVLVGIDVQLLPGMSVGEYFDSPEGKYSISFSFCSPTAQKSLTYTPRAPGNETFENRGVLCDANESIPEDFLDLPEAVQEARDRGMVSRVPESAALSGALWSIRGSSNIDSIGFTVPAQPVEYPPVRQIDACELVTVQDVDQALGVSVESVPPPVERSGRLGVWACDYQSEQDPSPSARVVQFTVDEDPFRDREGYINRLQQIAWTEVPGLGDRAYISGSCGPVTLDVLVGDTLFEFMTVGSGGPDLFEATKQLAEVSVGRYKSGEGIVMLPPPQVTIVGEWQLESSGERRVLMFKESGSWALSVFDSQAGAIIDEVKGYVEWNLLEPNRALLMSPAQNKLDLYDIETAIQLDQDTLEVRSRSLSTQLWGQSGGKSFS